jgi:hypothetical protein
VRSTNGGGPARTIVLPDPSWSDRRDVINALQESGRSVVDLNSPIESKAICAAIIGADVWPPVVIVAHGETCACLPAVALSLRTQHRDTAGYVLIDPDAPASTDTWPEAPVIAVSTTEPEGTSLRGWPILSAWNDVPAAVVNAVSTLLDA